MNEEQVRYLRELLDQFVEEGECCTADLLEEVRAWAEEYEMYEETK